MFGSIQLWIKISRPTESKYFSVNVIYVRDNSILEGRFKIELYARFDD